MMEFRRGKIVSTYIGQKASASLWEQPVEGDTVRIWHDNGTLHREWRDRNSGHIHYQVFFPNGEVMQTTFEPEGYQDTPIPDWEKIVNYRVIVLDGKGGVLRIYYGRSEPTYLGSGWIDFKDFDNQTVRFSPATPIIIERR